MPFNKSAPQPPSVLTLTPPSEWQVCTHVSIAQGADIFDESLHTRELVVEQWDVNGYSFHIVMPELGCLALRQVYRPVAHEDTPYLVVPLYTPNVPKDSSSLLCHRNLIVDVTNHEMFENLLSDLKTAYKAACVDVVNDRYGN